MKLALWIGIVLGSLLFHVSRQWLFGVPFNTTDCMHGIYWSGLTLVSLALCERYKL